MAQTWTPQTHDQLCDRLSESFQDLKHKGAVFGVQVEKRLIHDIDNVIRARTIITIDRYASDEEIESIKRDIVGE